MTARARPQPESVAAPLIDHPAEHHRQHLHAAIAGTVQPRRPPRRQRLPGPRESCGRDIHRDRQPQDRRHAQRLPQMLSSEDLSVVDDCLRACTRTRRGDPPAIGQDLVEHPRHRPHLAQPRPNPTLDHVARLGRRIQLAHRPIVDAGEPDAVADDKVFEAVRTTHDRLVTRRIRARANATNGCTSPRVPKVMTRTFTGTPQRSTTTTPTRLPDTPEDQTRPHREPALRTSPGPDPPRSSYLYPHGATQG